MKAVQHNPDVRVVIHDRFWDAFRHTARTEGIPYQWRALNDEVPDAAPSYCMRNFRAAAGKLSAPHGGFVFQDSDSAKWLEAVAYSLKWHPDPELEKTADAAIEAIVAAQQPDGYLDTYYILSGLEKRWTDLLDQHELYCAGHMIEAAVAYAEATGKRVLLDAMLRLVDHIGSVIGSEEGKLHGYPGHPEIELALVKLYRLTGDEKHLRLAEYFIRERGREPNFFADEIEKHGGHYYWKNGPLQLRYYQADKPLTEQPGAEGHAVRALYLYTGLADVARLTDAPDLIACAKKMWDSVVNRQMYITGAVGSSAYGEAFTFDYDLPNDTVYGESCASIALVFFARRMLMLEKDAVYADVMERALYNGILSGMQLDGKRFFYVNPLEVNPKASRYDGHKQHIRPERQKWFGCACCPPNIIRTLMSLQDYVASAEDDTLYIHLYAGGTVAGEIGGGELALSVETNYPWDGSVSIRVDEAPDGPCTLALRRPGWCDASVLSVNGDRCEIAPDHGYIRLTRQWAAGDVIDFRMEMPVRLCRANNAVAEDADRLAVTRGPIVYCLEETDNGPDLHLVRLGGRTGGDFTARFEPGLLGGVVQLQAAGLREKKDDAAAPLYTACTSVDTETTQLTWIPYYAWANRGIGEMRVWVRK